MNDDLTKVSLSGLLLRAEVQLERCTVPGEAAGALEEAQRIAAEIRARRDRGLHIAADEVG